MKTLSFFAALGAALLFAPPSRADVESGPKAGDKVAVLKAFGVVGTIEGKEADFAAERKDAPTIYLFVQAEEGGIRRYGSSSNLRPWASVPSHSMPVTNSPALSRLNGPCWAISSREAAIWRRSDLRKRLTASAKLSSGM
mgnify:CR=1 FL=1